MLSAISPDKTTVAVAQSGNVTLYSADDGNVHQTLGSVHAGKTIELCFGRVVCECARVLSRVCVRVRQAGTCVPCAFVCARVYSHSSSKHTNHLSLQ